MKKEFVLEKWLEDKSQKVITRSELPVRILAWDVADKYYPIVAVVKTPYCGKEAVKTYSTKGKLFIDDKNEYDLFLETDEVSEDEKIRKELLRGFNECLKEASKYPLNAQKYWHNIKIEDILAWLEKQGEKEPVEKVEPKFKVGDWVVLEAGELTNTLLITKVDELGRVYWFNDDSYLPFNEDQCLKLWTIQDAKPGDILADDGAIVMFRKIGNGRWDNVIDYYASYTSYRNRFLIQEGDSHWGVVADTSLLPATKEQRKRFFKKMRKEGYEWDAKELQLKKMLPL